MNAIEIVKIFAEAGVNATDVANALRLHAEVKKAYEQVESDYPTRCAQTVLLAATVDSKQSSQEKLAEESGVTSMTMGRWCAAGRVLIVHANLDPVAMVAYANQNTKKACHALTLMPEEEASDIIAPKKGQKTEPEKDLAAVEALLRRIRKAGESGDATRVEALDGAVTILMDAIAAAHDVSEGAPMEEVA